MTIFVPRDANLAKANLDKFIERYRSKGAWGMGRVPFSNDAWPLRGIGPKGVSGYVYFARSGYNGSLNRVRRGQPSVIPDDLRMPTPFRDFAKAMLCHLHMTKPSSGVKQRIRALVVMLQTLERGGRSNGDPTVFRVSDLESACELTVASGQSNTVQSNTAGQLSLIWSEMVSLELVQFPANWASPIRRMNSRDTLKLGPEFDANRRKKLPDPRALEACANIFQRDDTDIRSTFVSSYVALALCSPERSVEFLFSPANLLDFWTDPETGEKGVSLRWWPAKGAAPMLKTVDLSMTEIAIRAHERLFRLSEPARDLARWYEANPKRIYLPTHLEHLRHKEIIDINEAHAILYGGNVRKLDTYINEHASAKNFLKKNGVPFERGVGSVRGGQSATLRFSDLEQAVLRQIPNGFPIMDMETGLKFSDALCVMRRHEFAGGEAGFMPAIFQQVTYSMITGALGASASSSSIFDIHGFRAANGEELRLKTHQLRHFLNTLVRRGGALTEHEIAMWSGRKDIDQNSDYDHLSTDDKLHSLEVRMGFHSDTQPFGDVSNRIFVRRNEFGQIEKITAHITDIGYCLHDYMQSPCPLAKNCIQCVESLCIKGDLRSRRALEMLYSESHVLTEAARRDQEWGVSGADEWFVAHLEREQFLKNLLDIFDSPDIPNGTPVQLNLKSPNRLREALARRTIPVIQFARSMQSMQDVGLRLSAPGNVEKEFPDVN